eukprot:scaffold22617_cov66-Phaeocystis_antarctica.AAC.6
MASALVASVGTLRWLFESVGRRRRHRRLPRRLLPICGRLHLVPLVEKRREVSQKVWVESVSVTESVERPCLCELVRRSGVNWRLCRTAS